MVLSSIDLILLLIKILIDLLEKYINKFNVGNYLAQLKWYIDALKNV